MSKSPEQFSPEEVSETTPEVKIGQPVDSWTKEEFIEYGKFLLEKIKKLAPDVYEGSHRESIVASDWIADYIRTLYRDVEDGKLSLEDIGTTEEELKEMVASSKKGVFDGGTLTQEERDRAWQRVFKKST